MVEAVLLPAIGTVAAFRAEARARLARGIEPERLVWNVGAATDLFAAPEPDGHPRQARVTKEALDLLETALHHSDPGRFARAYRLLWRSAGTALDWADRTDPDLARLHEQAKAVRRDIHKMHAFVRFREIAAPGPRRAFAAWFEPAHPVTEAAAPFFARRFGDMDWAIATPHLTARFVAGELDFMSTDPSFRPPEDATEDLWRTYYASIFNPARLMVTAMQSEMPKKYWHNLPEARLIPDLIRTASARTQAMQAAAPGQPPGHAAALSRRAPPPGPVEGPPALAKAVDACRRCPIGAIATQGVPGEGPRGAPLMLVGEQPGDQEDRAGHPFVGPAGKVLDAAMEAAGIDRGSVFLTNAVKHFKFAPRGKRRLHQRPNAGEIQACRWWLEQELQLVRPKLVVALGATALAALTGSGDGILKRRGRIERVEDLAVLPTIHPSYLLRLREGAEAERDRFVADLQTARDFLDAA